MPKKRVANKRRRIEEVTIPQLLDLTMGPSHNPDGSLELFASEEERRQAWFDHRNEVLHEGFAGGRVPQAQEQYEGGVKEGEPQEGAEEPLGHDWRETATRLEESAEEAL